MYIASLNIFHDDFMYAKTKNRNEIGSEKVKREGKEEGKSS